MNAHPQPDRYIALPPSPHHPRRWRLGLAGMANAGTYSYEPTPRPGHRRDAQHGRAAAGRRDARPPLAQGARADHHLPAGE